MKRAIKNIPLEINGQKILPGETRDLTLSLARLYDYTQLAMPIRVFSGKQSGPVLFVSAAVHGDEINGIEVIRRLIKMPQMRLIHGTLITVPIVNVFGFNNKSRYLPDRRDLNRSFPGNAKGSLASQVAHTFMKEIVSKCDYGIDLHTGSNERENYPHIRAQIEDITTRKLAKSFGTEVVLHSNLRDGSLRQAATARNIKLLVFEGGEALRFTESAVKVALHGILSVMHHIGMLSGKLPKRDAQFIAKSSHWQRAPQSGIFTASKKLGQTVQEGEVLGSISDPFGDNSIEVCSNYSGVIIGRTTVPLIKGGEALYNIAVARDKKISTVDRIEYNLGAPETDDYY